MTVQAFLEEYRQASVEIEALQGYLRASGHTGAPGGVRTDHWDGLRGTNDPASAAAQHEAYCLQELTQRSARQEARTPVLEALLASLGAREALVLRSYLRGDTLEAIGRQMKLSPATVSRSCHKAVKQLSERYPAGVAASVERIHQKAQAMRSEE